MRRAWPVLGMAMALSAGCRGKPSAHKGDLDLGELKIAAASASGKGAQAFVPADSAQVAHPGGPKLGAVAFAVVIREKPDPRSAQIGYLRVGELVTRADKPAAYDACQNGYYNVLPRGYVCIDEGASIDLSHPLLRARLRQPDRDKPLPYSYAFVRAVAPRYYRLPSLKEQEEHEMALDRNMRSFGRLREKWTAYEVGSNDVPVDDKGAVIGDPPKEPPALDEDERFGGTANSKIPWFFDGGRKIPNIASFAVPSFAVMTNRIKRHAGVALLDAFPGDHRHFALTTDLRLIPTSKLKPGRGSVFHGVEMSKGWRLPLGFVKKDDACPWERAQGRFRRIKARLAYGTPIQLTGEAKGQGEGRYLEAQDGPWLRAADLAVAAKSSSLPPFAKGKLKWIDVSILRQTLTLFEGDKPLFATMVSTGKDGLGDPKTTRSTPTGTFHIRDKHVTTTMDSQVLGSEFELNDVPWVEYFQSGYALHAAYWHTEFGRPRSHGCINLAPLDALRLFKWTDPPLPDDWHGVSSGDAFGEGTTVYIHP